MSKLPWFDSAVEIVRSGMNELSKIVRDSAEVGVVNLNVPCYRHKFLSEHPEFLEIIKERSSYEYALVEGCDGELYTWAPYLIKNRSDKNEPFGSWVCVAGNVAREQPGRKDQYIGIVSKTLSGIDRTSDDEL